jgi:hypothetical protein
MKPEGSSPHSQAHAICPYPELSSIQSTHPHPSSRRSILFSVYQQYRKIGHGQQHLTKYAQSVIRHNITQAPDTALVEACKLMHVYIRIEVSKSGTSSNTLQYPSPPPLRPNYNLSITHAFFTTARQRIHVLTIRAAGPAHHNLVDIRLNFLTLRYITILHRNASISNSSTDWQVDCV